MNKSFLKKPVLLFLTLITLLACSKHEPSQSNNSQNNELQSMAKINVGEPYFTVSPGTPYNIYRVAWTGEKLWALTGIGNGDAFQKLLELDTANGSIIQAIPFNESDNPKQIFSLDYANGQLWDIRSFHLSSEQKYAKTYDATSAESTTQWNYNGKFDLYKYFTFDGIRYWGGTNYDFEGTNCQAITSYDVNGNIIKVFEMCGNEQTGDKVFPYGNDCQDMVYGGGYLWASRTSKGNQIISKVDSNLTIIKSYHIIDGDKFGEALFSDEIALHLEYIDGRLWIIDRFNNFYKTTIQ